MLRELGDLQFSKREFQTAGALTEKALADKAENFLLTVAVQYSIELINPQCLYSV